VSALPLNPLALVAVLLTLAALFGVINHLTLRLPNTIGVLLMSLLSSLAALAIDPLIPGVDLHAVSRSLLGRLDLPDAFLNGVLSFLLFAGSLHVNLGALWESKLTVLALATLGTVLAVAMLGGCAFLLFPLAGASVPLIWCIVLGAMLAPTDPVSVVAMLRRIGLPDRLQALFAGESLFNDGVGVVCFEGALAMAMGAAGTSGGAILNLLLYQALGGALLGLATGFVAVRFLERVDDDTLELLISLALATGTYSLAAGLHMSGPIAVVMAGLSMGSARARAALSHRGQTVLTEFWSIIDEVLNALLFLLLGFEVLSVPLHVAALLAAACAIPLSLMIRAASVLIAAVPMLLRTERSRATVLLLTWGGLRGGITVALALSLPDVPARPLLLTVCYVVVIFTIVVQGLTMEPLARRLFGGSARQES